MVFKIEILIIKNVCFISFLKQKTNLNLKDDNFKRFAFPENNMIIYFLIW